MSFPDDKLLDPTSWAWDSFNSIAPKVRIVNSWNALDGSLVAALLRRTKPTASSDFRIRYLDWMASAKHDDPPHVVSFMSTSLQQLRIYTETSPAKTLFLDIPTRSPYITNLTFRDMSGTSYAEPMMQALEGMLALLPNLDLVYLRLPNGSQNATRPLAILARHTELKELRLEGEGRDNREGTIHWPSSFESPAFPSLQSLNLKWGKHGIPLLLRSVESSSLRRIRLGYQSSGIADVSEAIKAAACHTQMEHLFIIGQTSDYPIDRLFLSPTHRFSVLRTLHISLNQPMEMTDADLELVLPNLTRLYNLTLTTFSRRVPTLTLRAYVFFARLCPEINFIKLAVNASAVDNAAHDIEAPHSRLADVAVHDSYIGEDHDVQGIAAFFIRLSSVGTLYVQHQAQLSGEEAARRWDGVARLIRALQQERDAKRRAEGAGDQDRSDGDRGVMGL